MWRKIEHTVLSGLQAEWGVYMHNRENKCSNTNDLRGEIIICVES